MTEPSPARPVPGPPSPGPGPRPDDDAARPTAERPAESAESAGHSADAGHSGDAGRDSDERFADLDQRPVSEHVAVFEAEHDRLRRELGTIDQL
jgi:hypothetical protein